MDKGYLTYLQKELNFSNNTIVNYQLDLADFFSFVKKNNIDYLNINRFQVRNYLKYLDERKLKNSTIARRISSLRSFYNYLVLKDYIKTNIFKSIRNPKIERKLPNFLNYDEIEDLLEHVNSDTDEGIRNRLMIEMFYATGCRVSEMINIRLEDINKTNRTIRIIGKGNKERIVYYGEYAAKYLDEYLKTGYNNDSSFLFVNSNKEKLTIQEVEQIIKHIVEHISIKTHVTPHTLRHTFATHLLNNGADIKTVQELLGHASLNTTGIYTHVTNDRIKEIYFKTFKR